MSTQIREPDDADSIILSREDDWFVARDERTGVASQGETRSKALANLAEALQLYEETDDEVETATPDAPWF
ncbi:type II toxin-antitoxin system HicB family antitoxin [Halococcus sp. IIIV-5B]|uniref:type II toxin-antitoxin system HicB family antitoxin n=1 Tax=Halococcus sp. IIIV-5B TaxID=2321230 RepID=UPI000E7707D8|nr:type II toxin-antitoxin system HicB family antitoxin [Halococcus sp. IIIV-5B]RJT04435.1 type II toxin-antitoxin system HicB family antitoxin [Halococcus sp. IIIV-5B]